MQRLIVWFISVSAAFTASLAGAAPLHKVPAAAPGAYVVILSADHPARVHAESMARWAGTTIVHTYDTVLNGFSVRTTEQKALALAKMPGVEAVWEVPRVRPDDVQYGPPQGLDRIDQRALPLNGQYSYFNYTTPTTIYVVDTGVDPRPSEFGTRLMYQINFTRNASGVVDPGDYTDGGLPLNDGWHGTAVAVIAAGANYGVARFAKIANVRVLPGDWDEVIAGVNWLTQQRNARPTEKHIANLSLGSDQGVAFNGWQPAIIAIQNSLNAGVGYVFSAGNDELDACRHFPAWMASQHSGAIAVGSSNPETDAVLTKSNQGPCVDIYAPSGVQWGDTINNSLAGGTSSAAPHVAGVFASRWANSPASSAGEIEGLIKGIGTPGVLSGLWPTSNNLLLYSLLPKRRPS